MKARHLAGSMCSFAVQRVLARAFRNISALARARPGGTAQPDRSPPRSASCTGPCPWPPVPSSRGDRDGLQRLRAARRPQLHHLDLRRASISTWPGSGARPTGGRLFGGACDPVLIASRTPPDRVEKAAVRNWIVAAYELPWPHPYSKPPQSVSTCWPGCVGRATWSSTRSRGRAAPGRHGEPWARPALEGLRHRPAVCPVRTKGAQAAPSSREASHRDLVQALRGSDV